MTFEEVEITRIKQVTYYVGDWRLHRRGLDHFTAPPISAEVAEGAVTFDSIEAVDDSGATMMIEIFPVSLTRHYFGSWFATLALASIEIEEGADPLVVPIIVRGRILLRNGEYHLLASASGIVIRDIGNGLRQHDVVWVDLQGTASVP